MFSLQLSHSCFSKPQLFPEVLSLIWSPFLVCGSALLPLVVFVPEYLVLDLIFIKQKGYIYYFPFFFDNWSLSRAARCLVVLWTLINRSFCSWKPIHSNLEGPPALYLPSPAAWWDRPLLRFMSFSDNYLICTHAKLLIIQNLHAPAVPLRVLTLITILTLYCTPKDVASGFFWMVPNCKLKYPVRFPLISVTTWIFF